MREAPLRPGGSVVVVVVVGVRVGWGVFCLETTLSNLLQDADISRKHSSWGGQLGSRLPLTPGVKSKQPGQSLQAARRGEQPAATAHAHHASRVLSPELHGTPAAASEVLHARVAFFCPQELQALNGGGVQTFPPPPSSQAR